LIRTYRQGNFIFKKSTWANATLQMRAEGVCEEKILNIFDAHLPAMPGPIQCNANANAMPPRQNEYVS